MKAIAIISLIGAASSVSLNQLSSGIDVNVKVNVNGEEVVNTKNPPTAIVPIDEIRKAVKDSVDVEKKSIQDEGEKVKKIQADGEAKAE